MKRWAIKWILRLTAFATLLLGSCVLTQVPGRQMGQAGKDLQQLCTTKPQSFHAASNEVRFVQVGNPKARTTFLFVHGTPGKMSNWGSFLADQDLKKSHRLVAFDRLGHGDSRAGVAEPSLEKQALALAQVAAKIPGRKIWVGHSYGVPVIAKLAALQPDLADGLVCVAGPAKAELVKKTWYQSLGETWLAQKIISPSWKVANIEMVALEGELQKLEFAWSQLTCPVTLIHAENDILADFRSVAFLKQEIPSRLLRTVELKTGNHFLIWSHRDLVISEMESLVK